MLQRLRGFDEDLTDQDFEYLSSSEGRPSSSNMYSHSDIMMLGGARGGINSDGGGGGGQRIPRGMGSRGSIYDSDAPSGSASEIPPYNIMYQNQVSDASVKKNLNLISR